jgi:Domain of unknown function (DUF397)
MSELVKGISESWRKSSRSNESGCVEVRKTSNSIQVRDSKNPDGAVLEFTPREWNAFLDGALLGEFSLPRSMPR